MLPDPHRWLPEVRGSLSLDHLLLIGVLLLPAAAFTQASIRDAVLGSFSLDLSALISGTGAEESASLERSEQSLLDGLTDPPQELLQYANGPGSPGPPGPLPPGPPMKPPKPEAPIPDGPNFFIPWLEEPYFVIDGERWPVSFLENGQVMPGIKIIDKEIRVPPYREPIDYPRSAGLHLIRPRQFLWDDSDISVVTEGGPLVTRERFETRYQIYPESDPTTEHRLDREGYVFDMESFTLTSDRHPGRGLNLAGKRSIEFHPDGIDDNVVLIETDDGERREYYRFHLHDGIDRDHPYSKPFEPTEHGPPKELSIEYAVTTEIEPEAHELLKGAGYRFDHDRNFFANPDHEDDPLNFWGRKDVAYYTDPSDDSQVLIRTVGNGGTVHHYRFDPTPGERTETDGVMVTASPAVRDYLSQGPWRIVGDQLLHESGRPEMHIELSGDETYGFNELVSFYEFPNPSPDYPGHVEGGEAAALVRVVEQEGDVVYYRFDQEENITPFTLGPHVSEEAQEVMETHGWRIEGAKLLRDVQGRDGSPDEQELGFGSEPVAIAIRKSREDDELFAEAVQANGHRFHYRIDPQVGSFAFLPLQVSLPSE